MLLRYQERIETRPAARGGAAKGRPRGGAAVKMDDPIYQLRCEVTATGLSCREERSKQ